MAPTIREVLSNNAANAAASVTTGAGTATNDVLVCFHATDFYAAASMSQPTQPSGVGAWTTQATADLGTNDTHVKCYTATVTSGGAKTISVSPVTDEECFIGLYVVSGVSTIADGGAQTNLQTTVANGFTLPSVSPTGSDDVYLGGCATGGSAIATFGTPTGMVKDGEQSNFVTLAIFSQTLSASGATGTKTANYTSGSRTSAAIAITLAGSGGGTTPNPRQPIVESATLPLRQLTAGKIVQANSVKFSNAADAAARQIPRLPVTVLTAQPARQRLVGGITTPERIPVPQVAYQGGMCALGLSGDGLETASVLRTSQVVLATAQPARQRLVGGAVTPERTAQPPSIPTAAEQGIGALGLAATGSQSSIRALSGSSSLGVAVAGTAVKSQAQAGTAALGLAGMGVDKKLAVEVGSSPAGLSATGTAAKKTAQLGTAAAGLVGTHSGLVIRPVSGTAYLGLATTGLQKKTVTATGAGAFGFAPRATQTKAVAPAGVAALGLAARAVLIKKVGSVGASALGLSIGGSANKAVGSGGIVTLGLSADASTVFVLDFHPRAGTVADLAERQLVGTIADLAEREMAGAVADLAVRYHAGTPT